MSGVPSDATIWTRERRYFFTSRSHSTMITAMRLPPPHPNDLAHLVGGGGALVPDRRAGERQERRFQRIGAGLCLELRRRTRGDDAPVIDHRDAIRHAVGFDHGRIVATDRKSTRLNSSHVSISYAVFCLKKKTL